MEPLLILVVIPVVIGIAAEVAFRDARNASLAATLGTLLSIGAAVHVLGSDVGWGWLAALLVSPLPIACSVATALLAYGHFQERRRRRRS
jgi:hypothetical protein